MAGCFGNSDYDRYEEGRLMQHLAKEAEWDNFCESVWEECSKIDPVLADSGDFDIYFNDDPWCAKILNDFSFEQDISKTAKLIMDGFIQTASEDKTS